MADNDLFKMYEEAFSGGKDAGIGADLFTSPATNNTNIPRPVDIPRSMTFTPAPAPAAPAPAQGPGFFGWASRKMGWDRPYEQWQSSLPGPPQPQIGGPAPAPNIFDPSREIFPQAQDTVPQGPINYSGFAPQQQDLPIKPLGTAGMRSFATPSGGTAFLPKEGAESIQEGVERSRARRELEAQGLSGMSLERALMDRGFEPTAGAREQQRRANEFQAEKGAQAIARYLNESGMSRDEIAKEVEFEKGMDPTLLLNRLRMLRARKQREGMQGRNAQRRRERIAERTKYTETGDPANDAARFEQIDSAMNTPVDPSTEKPVSDYMTPAERKRYEGIGDRISMGTLKGSRGKDDMNWVVGVQKRAAVRAAQEVAKEAYKKAQKVAQTKEQQRLLDNAMDELKTVQNKMKDDKTKSDEYKELKNQQDGIMRYINEVNVRGAAAFEQETQGGQTDGNQGQTGTTMVSMIAPDGRRLSVPADRVPEMEEKGATRA